MESEHLMELEIRRDERRAKRKAVKAADEKEESIDVYYEESVNAAGGGTRKIAYRGRRGAADHLTAFPCNRLFLVELKRPVGGRIRHHQWEDSKWLAGFGVQKEFLHTRAAIDTFIQRVTKGRHTLPVCEPACICERCVPCVF